MTNVNLELLFATMLILGGGVHAVSKARSRGSVGLVDIAFWACAVFFGLGLWLAFLYSGGTLPYVPADVLALAYGGVALHMIGLLAVGRMFTPGAGMAETLRKACTLGPAKPLLVLGVLWLLRCVLALRYGLLFSGTMTAERMESLPYFLFAISSVMYVAAAGAVVWAAAALFERRLRHVGVVAFVLEVAWAFLQGRRAIASVLVIAFLVMAARRRGVSRKHLIAGASVAAVLLLWVFPAFIGLRAVYDHASTRGSVHDLRAAVGTARTQDVETVDEGFRKNMAGRPLIVRFNCGILERQRAWGPMWGAAMLGAFRWSVPVILYPQKRQSSAPEVQIAEHYALPRIDWSSNWPAYGCADFGPWGGFVSGVMLGLLLVLTERWALRVHPQFPLLSLCVLAGGLVIALGVEETPTRAWNTLRGLLLLWGFAAGWRFLEKLGVRRA